MGTLSINLGAIKDSPIPDGIYPVIIAKAQDGLTQKNLPKLDVQIKITDGPEAERIVYDTITIDGNPDSFSMKKLKQLLIACGMAENFASEAFDPEELIGEEVVAKLRMGKPSKEIDQSTGQPYPARVGVVEYMPQGYTPSVDKVLKQAFPDTTDPDF
jgi:hypothetical protein